jgi:hypothetical protein
MLALLLAAARPATVPTLSVAAALSAASAGPAFIIAASSERFSYPRVTRAFTRAAHLSTLAGVRFAVVDVAGDPDAPRLNLSYFPAVLHLVDGAARRVHTRGFDEELLLAFMNSQSASGPPLLADQAALDAFLSENLIALLIGVGDDGAAPELAAFCRDHYHEITAAYVAPSLLPSPGVWLYRYSDGCLVRLPDLAGRGAHEIAVAVAQNLAPEFAKFSGGLAGLYERENQTYVVLMLGMEDFYLTGEQLRFARRLRDATGLNVTYNDNENTQALAMRYGLPDSLDSTMAVIVTGGRRPRKYMLPDKLTLESAVRLVDAVADGTAAPFWRSEAGLSKGEPDGLAVVTANSLLEQLQARKSIVLLVYWPGAIPEAFVNATAIARQANAGVTFGKFCASTNDWPTDDDQTIAAYPWVLVYVEGVNVHSGPVKETTEEIAMEIAAALAKKADDNL